MVSASVVTAVIERTEALAAIPAPPLHEGDRAEVVGRWWSASLGKVIHDAVGNVWGRVRPGPGPALVIAAHLDTVFEPDVVHGATRHDGRLHGPSVGDDSVAVAALGALDELLPADLGGELWILATVGEEGMGDLLGIRHALADPPPPVAAVGIGAVVAIEGDWLGRVCLIGVGSVRWRVTLRGPSGHAWSAAHVDSAVHGAARVVAALDAAPRPEGVRTAVNVGRIGGGTAINIRAGDAWFDVDLRAEDPATLEALEQTFDHVVAHESRELDVTLESLGRRPAGRLDPGHPLAQAATDALEAAGIDPEITAASTDANAAHAAGVPALAVGITTGEGQHTIEEWIDLEPIETGLAVLADTVIRYVRSAR